MSLQAPGPQSTVNNSTPALAAGACGVRVVSHSILALMVGACTGPLAWVSHGLVMVAALYRPTCMGISWVRHGGGLPEGLLAWM